MRVSQAHSCTVVLLLLGTLQNLHTVASALKRGWHRQTMFLGNLCQLQLKTAKQAEFACI